MNENPVLDARGQIARWMSDDLYRAKSNDQKFYFVEGANHMQFYDVPSCVEQALSVPAPFFRSKL
jgi:fermentation-respiration switch protein FrsA (DUF1100 family)